MMNSLFDHTNDHRKDGSIRWLQPEGRDDVIGMGTADLDYSCAPCIRDALRKVAEENTFNYRIKPDSYYTSLINWFDRHYGLQVNKEWIFSVPGTLAAVRMAVECYSQPNDYVLMQTPYFGPLVACITGCGRRFLENPMTLKDGRYEIDFELFEKQIREYRPSVFLLVSPHNPTGRVFSREELQRMVAICAEYQVTILSDEVHFLVTYDDHKFVPILAVSEEARKISVQIFSFSKGFNIMSLPHALIFAADEELRRRWNTYVYPFNYHYASNSFCIAAVEALTSEAGDQWLKELNQYLLENRNYLIDQIRARELPLQPICPEAGFLCWIDCRQSGIDAEKIDDVFLQKAGISLNNGLGHGEAGRGFVRLNFAVTRSHLEEALDRMEVMLKHNSK